ncbi:MAG: 3-hydroxyacyl-CoA dehydrogenase family protein [Chitinophagaceae bacterium]
MNVWVITDEALYQEMMAATVSPEISVKRINKPDQIDEQEKDFVVIDLLFDYQNSDRLQALLHTGASLILINEVIETCAGWPPHVIRFNGWPGFLRRTVSEMTGGDAGSREQAADVMQLLGREAEWVPDVSGMLTPRVVCMIINEAFFTLSEEISTEQEIDTALKLGTNYPWGPFEWCKLLGIRNVYTLLGKLAAEHPRYQPAALLQQRALAQ